MSWQTPKVQSTYTTTSTHTLQQVQPGAVKIGSLLVPDAPELHASVTSENQFHCTKLYSTCCMVFTVHASAHMKSQNTCCTVPRQCGFQIQNFPVSLTLLHSSVFSWLHTILQNAIVRVKKIRLWAYQRILCDNRPCSCTHPWSCVHASHAMTAHCSRVRHCSRTSCGCGCICQSTLKIWKYMKKTSKRQGRERKKLRGGVGERGRKRQFISLQHSL